MTVTINQYNDEKENKPIIRIGLEGDAKGSQIEKIREVIPSLLLQNANKFYLDIRKLTECDLGFVNEVIHIHYTFAEYSKEFVLLYSKGSFFESWIKTSDLHKVLKISTEL